jgi:hypothetical protein
MKPDPQEIYARWLGAGTKLVFGFAVLSLALYLAGVLAPLVPFAELPRLWTLSAADMMREAHAPGGWDWLRFLRYGDYLNVLAIAFFPLLALVCTARVVPAFLKDGEPLHAALALLVALVLLAAAL